MAFSRAKLHRFNEVSGCAPPPGTYQPRWKEKSILGVFEKSKRFDESKPGSENIPENLLRASKTPAIQKKTLSEKQLSSSKAIGLNRTAFPHSSKKESPKQEIKQLSKTCGCSCYIKDAEIKYAAQIKQLLDKHRREAVHLETLKVKMDVNAVIVSDLADDILHYKDRISCLNTANAELAERMSSLQQLTIEYRLQIAELQDGIDCITAERNELMMDHKMMKKELKGMEIKVEKLNLKAAEAEASVASEREAKRVMEVKCSGISKEMESFKDEVKKLHEQLDIADNDLAVEKANVVQMQNRYENSASENREVADLKEKEFNKKIIEAESIIKDKIQELSETKKELERMREGYASEVARRNDAEEEMSKSLKGSFLKVGEVAQLREEMETEMVVRFMSLLNSGQLDLPTGKLEVDKFSVHGIFEIFQDIQTDKENLAASNNVLKSELAQKEEYIRSLENLVGPFREQLEMYEQERHALQNITLQARDELEQLALQHAAALGHQNHKQKIKYLVQLKDHNLKLKKELQDLKNKLRHKERLIAKLRKQEKGGSPKVLHVSEKENTGK